MTRVAPTCMAREFGQALFSRGQTLKITVAQIACTKRFMDQTASHRGKNRAPLIGKGFFRRVEYLIQDTFNPSLGTG